MEKEIKKLTKEFHLEEWIRDTWEISCGKSYYTSVSFGETVLKKGMYYEYIGHQHRTMDRELCSVFSDFQVYGKLEDVELARTFISKPDPYGWDKGRNYADENFKADFIDKFVFGESWFWVAC